jgi:hypothetical protein
MRRSSHRIYAVALAGLCCVCVASCDGARKGGVRAREENYGTDTRHVHYSPGEVAVLAVDFTTNAFLGGYTLPVAGGAEAFELAAEYTAPGDFGSVAIREKGSGTLLFAGGIVWMGSGRMTYPETMHAPGSFASATGREGDLPPLTLFDYSGGDAPLAGKTDLATVMEAVGGLQAVRRAVASAPDAPVYATLYARSVGAGDPTEWYWLIFVRG